MTFKQMLCGAPPAAAASRYRCPSCRTSILSDPYGLRGYKEKQVQECIYTAYQTSLRVTLPQYGMPAGGGLRYMSQWMRDETKALAAAVDDTRQVWRARHTLGGREGTSRLFALSLHLYVAHLCVYKQACRVPCACMPYA